MMPAHRPQRKYIAVLAIVSTLILIIGVKVKPKKVAEISISQADMLRLQMRAQRRNLEEITSFFSGVAEGVKSGVVWVRGLDSSGVIWDGTGLVVASCPRHAAGSNFDSGGLRLEPDVVSENYPLVALRAPAEAALEPVFRTAAAAVEQGSWILQVTAREDGGHLYTPGTYGGTVSIRCGEFTVQSVRTNLPLGESVGGGGVFDMDGNLLGVVLRCGSQYAAVTPEGVDAILAAARSYEGRLLRRYGFRAVPLDEESQTYFKVKRGVLVTEVWNEWPAQRAGLMPGDIIQGLDAGEVRSLEDLARLLLPMAYPTYDLWVWRSGKTRRITMPATEREYSGPAADEGKGIFLRPPLQGYLIEEIVPGSRADRADLKQGDRLLRIGGKQPRSLALARSVLSQRGTEPVFVIVQRGRRQRGVFLK